jgi:hypothetical protein
MTDEFDTGGTRAQISPGWRRFVPFLGRGSEGAGPPEPEVGPGQRLRRLVVLVKWLGGALLALGLLYYPVGALLIHRINDELDFTTPAIPAGASQTVALAAHLIDREVAETAWPGNDPWFMPGAILDNMPNFQAGEIQALQRIVTELRDQIGRARGTSGADSGLQDAASSLNNKPDIWYFDLERSWMPVTPSDDYYLAAGKALNDYNGRLVRGEATFERRADNLLTTLDRIGKDLGAASNKIDTEIDLESGAWFDLAADDIFYFNKGQLYAYGLLLRELGQDFRAILEEKGALTVWKRMVDSMGEGATLRPWVVINGRPASLFQPNHLAEQGFYLLRARAQLEEIVDILQK